MKRVILSMMLMFASASILRAEEPELDVLVREPIIRFVRRPDLPAHCGTDAKIHACTAFAGQRLACACEAIDDGWRIDAHAQVIPVMYILGPDHVIHERDHVEDVRTSVVAYVSMLGALRFGSAGECRAEADRRMAGFAGVMDGFKLESQHARHPGFVYRVAGR